MRELKIKNSILLSILYIIISCKSSKYNHIINTSIIYTGDSAVVSVNEDSICTFSIFNKSRNNIGISKKIIYPLGYLSYDKNFVDINSYKNYFVIIQEFGSSSPEGWYKVFASYKQKKYYVDSIVIESKNWKATNSEQFLDVKSKYINKPLFETNIFKEINNF